MKLYSNNQGQWVTSKYGAKQKFGYRKGSFTEFDIPKSKVDFVDWLNKEKLSSNPTIEKAEINKVELNTDDTQELLSSHAASWVNWAYETLRRGDKNEAEAMLLRGLEIEYKIKKKNV